MVVNLSYSFIPLQKILQKGVDRPVENPRKSAVVTKTKTITITKTPYENEDPSRKRKHITKTSSKEVGITFVDKDYVHEAHYENEDPYGNLEF